MSIIMIVLLEVYILVFILVTLVRLDSKRCNKGDQFIYSLLCYYYFTITTADVQYFITLQLLYILYTLHIHNYYKYYTVYKERD